MDQIRRNAVRGGKGTARQDTDLVGALIPQHHPIVFEQHGGRRLCRRFLRLQLLFCRKSPCVLLSGPDLESQPGKLQSEPQHG
jgi:hypothetical protein